MTTDERWMARCLQLARCGCCGAPPNPMVGAVIVYQDRIIGEGYHVKCGEAHAEVNAFAAVTHPEWLKDSTLYVSLEPCSHFGRTPPCADLIVRKGVRRVVVGCIDPYSEVSGRGVRLLRQAGIEVEVGVLEKECMELNRKFIVSQTQGRPFVTLKWAESADGFMASEVLPSQNIFISTPRTLMRAHRLRSEHQAVMIGRRTAQLDNPSLTVRRWSGPQPLRVVLDRDGVLSPSLHIFDGEAPTLVCGGRDNGVRRSQADCDYIGLDYGRPVLPQVLAELQRRRVQSLLVEGGRQLLQSFIDAGLWDEAHVEIGNARFGGGLPAPDINLPPVTEEILWGHTVKHYRHTDGVQSGL